MFSCNNTEEASLLSSLNEIVKVWARGSGQAKFDLNICDGVAELSLNFKLGRQVTNIATLLIQPSNMSILMLSMKVKNMDKIRKLSVQFPSERVSQT